MSNRYAHGVATQPGDPGPVGMPSRYRRSAAGRIGVRHEDQPPDPGGRTA
ncbi:hypothetical protein OG216_36350 [Streptomycetaceae bacterium NBC_01309]